MKTGKKKRLVNGTISAIKDANPKIVLIALECVQTLLDDYMDIFQSSLNMTFDIVLTRLGDSKVHSIILFIVIRI